MPPPPPPKGAWRFRSASGGAPVEADQLFSLNDFKGRQTWEFDPSAGEAELERIEELRAAFAANRHTQKHRRARRAARARGVRVGLGGQPRPRRGACNCKLVGVRGRRRPCGHTWICGLLRGLLT